MFQESGSETMIEIEETVEYQPRPLSSVLNDLAQREGSDKVTMRCIREALADRSLATFLILSGLLNLLPFPPPSTLILGIPIIAIALQMIAGRKTVWLPEFFLNLSMNEKAFAKFTTKIVPWLRKLETIVRPRFWLFPSAQSAERVVGLIGLALGLFVFIPLPMTNWIPALAVAVCGLALSERDGLWLSIGTIVGGTAIIGIGSAYYFGALAFTGWIAS